jgi:hypothetical protein
LLLFEDGLELGQGFEILGPAGRPLDADERRQVDAATGEAEDLVLA